MLYIVGQGGLRVGGVCLSVVVFLWQALIIHLCQWVKIRMLTFQASSAWVRNARCWFQRTSCTECWQIPNYGTGSPNSASWISSRLVHNVAQSPCYHWVSCACIGWVRRWWSSPDIVPSCWPGSKHRLSNELRWWRSKCFGPCLW